MPKILLKLGTFVVLGKMSVVEKIVKKIQNDDLNSKNDSIKICLKTFYEDPMF